MKTTAMVLWVGAGLAFLVGFGLFFSDHPSLGSFLVLIALIAAPCGLIVFCIGQATEIVLNRIDRRAAELAARDRDPA